MTDLNAIIVGAERRGLRVAILCRTIAVGTAFLWLFLSWLSIGRSPYVWSVVVLGGLTLFGLLAWILTHERYDVWWAKYALYAADVLAVCSLFAFFPVSRGADVPQIVAFRSYGIYVLFPIVALAALSLSWRLVAWTSAMVVVGWWSAFLYVQSSMERRLSWRDMPMGADAEDYAAIFMSLDFVGTGNRVQEAGVSLIAGAIIAVAVYRARLVFCRQVEAERERSEERDRRERITRTFGRFVPPSVAQDLIEHGALEPKMMTASVLVLDIASFTSFSETRDPIDVTRILNRFLTRAARVVAEYRGTVVSFTGDGMLATFGAPAPCSDHARLAVRAAVALDAASVRDSFRVRIGIATGDIATGTIGAEDRQAFTVYGHTVNLAARLEQAAKGRAEAILLDEATANGNEPSDVRRLETLDLPGFARTVPVWTLGRASEMAKLPASR